MKIRRQKQVRRSLTFYKNNFGIKPPYHILVDGTFCRAALKFKLNIGEQMPKYLQGEVELQTTSCIIKECELLGTLLYGPLKLLRQYRLISCKHSKQPVSAAECMLSLARKPESKLMFATLDKVVSEKLRQLPGRPLLYLAYNAIHLEAPAQPSTIKAEATEHSKLEVSEVQQQALKSFSSKLGVAKEELAKHLPIVKKELDQQTGSDLKKRRRKGPKGPNPLSCKKKKSKASEPARKKPKVEV